jgi:hypothetical protein
VTNSTGEKLPRTWVAKSGIGFGLCIFLFVATLSGQGQSPAPDAQSADNKQAAPTGGSGDELRKAAQNPIASLISVPLQNNTNFGIQPGERTQDVLNIQPVIPIGISKDWNLIIRWIAPIIWQPLPASPPAPEVGKYGFGDMQPSFFLAPKRTGKLIWGAGPVVQFPTATDTYLGQGKLGIGPTIVVLTQPGPWTIGALVNNVWSVAGSGGRPDVNQMTLQYFINYNLKKGWYLTSGPILTANWEATNGDRWVVPFGGGVGRVMRVGMQPVNLQLGFYGNAVHPANASPWSMRVQLVFLFPKKN